jgi:hypothetical protein
MTRKTQHSDYWLGSRADLSGVRTESELLMRLSNIRKGIANFVKIMTNRDIPVKFSSGDQSYTNDKVVVISASPNPEHFDSMVGLALHESSHILYSQGIFPLFETLAYTPDKFLTPKLLDGCMKLYGSSRPLRDYTAKFAKHLKLIINYLEDRKIDFMSYQLLGGYRPYYEALYDRYMYNDEIGAALHHPEFRKPYLKSYEVHLLGMLHPDADPDALPGLKDIWNIINLKYIERYQNDPRWEPWVDLKPSRLSTDDCGNIKVFKQDVLPLVVQDAQRILEIIYENAIAGSPEQNEMGEESDGSDSDEGLEDDELENLDGETGDEGDEEGDEDAGDDADGDEDQKSSKPQKGKPSKKQMKDALDKMRKFVNGEVDKREMNDEQSELMNELETADAELREAGAGISAHTKVPVIVYRKLDDVVMASDSYPFKYHGMYWGQEAMRCRESETAIKDGTRMGAMLVHRLRIMNDESTMRYSRQDHGKIDRRLVHQLGFGDDNVFAVDHTVRIKPVMVDISIDSSGSMNGPKWQKALTFAIAMAYVAEKTRSVRIRINIRTTVNEPVIGVIYDSATDKFVKIRKFFPFIGPTGGTPEGLTFEAILHELLEDVKNTRRFFVNLSDGEPSYHWRDISYSGLPAARHTKTQVDELKARGIHVLSYFISEYSKEQIKKMNENKQTLFHTMYGPDARFIDVGSITDIARTLNEFFLKE